MTLHPAARRLLDEMSAQASAGTPDVVAERAASREAALALPRRPLGHVADDVVARTGAPDVPVRLYRPRPGAPVALYVHGGGWVFHDLETHDDFCRYLSARTGWALLAVGHRQAPEDPYPAGLDDVQAAAGWLRAHGERLGVDAAFLPGIGDSSGGNLVAALTVRDPRALDARVLVYPVVDRRADLDRHLDNAALDADGMDWYWDAYAPGELADHPEVSVARAPALGDQPPTFLVTAEHDGLRDQAEEHAAALAEAGVDVVAHRVLGMVHGFWRQPETFAAARATVGAVGAWLDEQRDAQPVVGSGDGP